MKENETKIPKLRFPEFQGNWDAKPTSEVLEREVKPVKVVSDKEYQEIGIRSHGKGLFHKDITTGKNIGNKRVFWISPNTFIVNIVFAWEQAVAKTTNNEVGLIASHRFPMYKPKKNILSLDFILYLFLTRRGKYLLEMASPGGAGRNKTLGQKEFEKVKINLPTYPEQQKIASFLTSVDDKIQQLKQKKELLEKYKKGVMQKIFKQEIRFKDDDGKEFPDWEEYFLKRIISLSKGEQLNKEYLNNDSEYPAINGGTNPSGFTENWNTKENTITISEGGNSCGFVNFIKTKFWAGGHCYVIEKISEEKVLKLFLYHILKFNEAKIMKLRVGSGLPNIQKKDIERYKIVISNSLDEQSQIAMFISNLDNKIEKINTQLENTQTFKKGLLQQMFV